MKCSENSVPSNALKGGHTKNEPIYIGRAKHEKEFAAGANNKKKEFKNDSKNDFTGSVLPSQCKLLLEYYGKTYTKTEFEILVGGSSAYWVTCDNGKFPANAVVAGHFTNPSTILHVGRIRVNDQLIVGKVNGADRKCYIPNICGTVPHGSKFEVLVI